MRGSFVYITASMGSHIGGDVEEEEMSEEEGNNHVIDLPDDDIEDENLVKLISNLTFINNLLQYSKCFPSKM